MSFLERHKAIQAWPGKHPIATVLSYERVPYLIHTIAIFQYLTALWRRRKIQFSGPSVRLARVRQETKSRQMAVQIRHLPCRDQDCAVFIPFTLCETPKTCQVKAVLADAAEISEQKFQKCFDGGGAKINKNSSARAARMGMHGDSMY